MIRIHAFRLLILMLIQALSLPAGATNDVPGPNASVICPLSGNTGSNSSYDTHLMSLDFILTHTQGRRLYPVATYQRPRGFELHSKKPLEGKYFVAIGSAKDFLTEAVEKGATGLMVSEEIAQAKAEELATLSHKVPVIVVSQMESSLESLAVAWRERLRESRVTITALSGSNGKTTIKDFTKTLAESQLQTGATLGNYNNNLGAPITILHLTLEHQLGIVEMGMNSPGELTRLVTLYTPDNVVVSTVGLAHVGNFTNEDDVRKAKYELYQHAPAKSTFAFNLSNPHTLRMYQDELAKDPSRRMFLFKHTPFDQKTGAMSGQISLPKRTPEETADFSKAEVSLKMHSMDITGLTVEGDILGVSGKVRIPIFGAHNFINILASLSLALASDVSAENLWKALAELKTPDGRGQISEGLNGSIYISDMYNASPDSVKALLQNMSESHLPEGRRKMVVLGEMLEMGELSQKFHREMGENAAKAGLDRIWFYATSQALCDSFLAGFASVAPNETGKVYTNCAYSLQPGADNEALREKVRNAIAEQIRQELREGDIIAFKASNGTGAQHIRNRLENK